MLQDWAGEPSPWSHWRLCNELPGFDTVFPRSLTHTSRQTDRVLVIHSAVDLFTACTPPHPHIPLPVSSLFQSIRHDSTSWLWANSPPEDISCSECTHRRDCRWGHRWWWMSTYQSSEGVRLHRFVPSKQPTC